MASAAVVPTPVVLDCSRGRNYLCVSEAQCAPLIACGMLLLTADDAAEPTADTLLLLRHGERARLCMGAAAGDVGAVVLQPTGETAATGVLGGLLHDRHSAHAGLLVAALHDPQMSYLPTLPDSVCVRIAKDVPAGGECMLLCHIAWMSCAQLLARVADARCNIASRMMVNTPAHTLLAVCGALPNPAIVDGTLYVAYARGPALLVARDAASRLLVALGEADARRVLQAWAWMATSSQVGAVAATAAAVNATALAIQQQQQQQEDAPLLDPISLFARLQIDSDARFVLASLESNPATQALMRASNASSMRLLGWACGLAVVGLCYPVQYVHGPLQPLTNAARQHVLTQPALYTEQPCYAASHSADVFDPFVAQPVVFVHPATRSGRHEPLAVCPSLAVPAPSSTAPVFNLGTLDLSFLTPTATETETVYSPLDSSCSVQEALSASLSALPALSWAPAEPGARMTQSLPAGGSRLPMPLAASLAASSSPPLGFFSAGTSPASACSPTSSSSAVPATPPPRIASPRSAGTAPCTPRATTRKRGAREALADERKIRKQIIRELKDAGVEPTEDNVRRVYSDVTAGGKRSSAKRQRGVHS